MFSFDNIGKIILGFMVLVLALLVWLNINTASLKSIFQKMEAQAKEEHEKRMQLYARAETEAQQQPPAQQEGKEVKMEVEKTEE